ncbi:hypothetical protein [Actinokineospora iranica]|uniref:Capsular polysaccharide biosynthesis protein n=1 Tax=Actinokineospora iranica TaxID=1271860 RepID=A0A1G6V6F8_9PSEU|nr:hypothetical protein [Actinokineospora iranica]SDD48436.1 hypothetical protein SAMN05216174_111239 [Actinokineospora iranica]
MDLRSLFSLVLRRWLVVVPLLVLAVAGAGFAYLNTPVRYSWTGTAVLLAPRTGPVAPVGKTVVSETNSLLAFRPSLSTTAALLIDDVGSRAAKLSREPKETVEITREGPFLTVAVEGATHKRATDLGASAFSLMRVALDKEQRFLGAPESTLITLHVVTSPVEPVKVTKARTTMVGAALGGGGLLALICAFAADSVADARRRSHARTVTAPSYS